MSCLIQITDLLRDNRLPEAFEVLQSHIDSNEALKDRFSSLVVNHSYYNRSQRHLNLGMLEWEKYNISVNQVVDWATNLAIEICEYLEKYDERYQVIDKKEALEREKQELLRRINEIDDQLQHEYKHLQSKFDHYKDQLKDDPSGNKFIEKLSQEVKYWETRILKQIEYERKSALAKIEKELEDLSYWEVFKFLRLSIERDRLLKRDLTQREEEYIRYKGKELEWYKEKKIRELERLLSGYNENFNNLELLWERGKYEKGKLMKRNDELQSEKIEYFRALDSIDDKLHSTLTNFSNILRVLLDDLDHKR